MERRPQKVSRARARRVARVLLAALAAWPLVAWGAARALVLGGGAETARADAIAVLAGSSAYRERARRAAELFREGRAPLIVLTDDGERGGWSEQEQRNPLFVERAADELRAAGVPAERIVVAPGVVTSTREEALRLRELSAARGWRALVVVTSPYHARRALWTLRGAFSGAGVSVSLAPSRAGGPDAPAPLTWWLRPRGWQTVGGEYVKLAYYRLRY